MDEQLAKIYNTNQSYDAEDLEKTAAAELLVKLAEEQGVDLRDFSDEEIAQLVQELYSGEKTAEEKKEEKKEPPKEEKKEEEAKEKAAEADFLGRVMAHAYVQEINLIEKEAAAGDAPGRVRKVIEAIKGHVGKAKEHFETVGEGARALATGKTRGGTAVSRKGIAKELATELKPEAKVVGGVAALEAARRLGKHQGEKRASAMETLIEKRAYEILAGNGWVNEQGELLAPPQADQPEQAKEASVLEQAVEVEALKLLEANGYPVEWNQ